MIYWEQSENILETKWEHIGNKVRTYREHNEDRKRYWKLSEMNSKRPKWEYTKLPNWYGNKSEKTTRRKQNENILEQNEDVLERIKKKK